MCCVQTIRQYVFSRSIPKLRHFVHPVWSVLCTVSLFVFLQLKVNSPSALSSFFINPQRLSWAHKLCFCITLLYIYTVIHAAPLGASKYNRLLSSSTGADGIKGKGCSLTCALFRFLFTFSSNSVKQQMEQCHGSGEAAKSRSRHLPGFNFFLN